MILRDHLADVALRSAAGCWFFVTLTGQWLFLYYIVVLYYAKTLSGHFEDWKFGYTPGDTAGNLAFAAHVLFAAVIAFGGLLQLIPQIRARAIAVHRWNGRAFLVAATVVAGGGLYLTWVRNASYLLRFKQVLVNAISVSLNSALILVFVALAWRAARVRDIERHRRWALRAFMVVNGSGYFVRVAEEAWPVFAPGLGMTRMGDGPMNYFLKFASYLLPLAVLELYLRARGSAGATARFATAIVIVALTAYVTAGTLAGAVIRQRWISEASAGEAGTRMAAENRKPGDAKQAAGARNAAAASAAEAARTANEARSAQETKAELNCPGDMVPVSGGTLSMGSPTGVGDDDERPRHAVALSGYCIDRTEVTVAAYARCVASRKCTAAPAPARDGFDSLCNSTRADRQEHPVNCVDWNQAAAYCAWANKRLPSEAEWEYAARGGDGRLYPWGNEAPGARRLNACGSECRALGKRLGLGWTAIYDDSDGWEATAPVGSFPGGASPFGALDMAGNVWEWTADWSGGYATGASTNPHGPKDGTARVMRGGGWIVSNASWVRAADRYGDAPAHRSAHLGFRCARGD